MSIKSALKNLSISLFILAGVFLLSQISKSYDDQTTHPGLTDEIVDFYNLSFSDKLTTQQKEWIVQGSIEEDIPPRWINHFYDPINGDGWKAENLGNVSPFTLQLFSKIFFNINTEIVSSKNWAHNEILQAKYANYGGNRTWENAIRRYAIGDEEYAFKTLGYILHLLEDATVPEHTRNDTHAHEGSGLTNDEGSPYEDFGKNFNRNNLNIAQSLKNENKQLVVLNSIDAYFDALANYSNQYFFSEHTINSSKYEKPEILREDNDYGYGEDENENEFVLVNIKSIVKENFNIEKIYTLKDNKNNNLVLLFYFSRLSSAAVLHGAGAIKLFIEEAEKAKNNKNSLTEEPKISWLKEMRSPLYGSIQTYYRISSAINNVVIQMYYYTSSVINNAVGRTRSLFASINNSFSGAFNNNGGFQLVEQIGLDQSGQNQITENLVQTLRQCSFNTSQAPLRQGVIINEVAWMGGVNNADDEWIELKNISGGELNLNGYQLIDQAEQIRIVFNGNDKIPAGGFELLERTDDNSAPGVSADKIYSGALANANEGLRLFDGNCNLIDEVFAASNWPAGDNEIKKTAERSGNFIWYTSAVSGGTPKKENSAPQPFLEEEDNEVVQVLSETNVIQQIASSSQQTQQAQQTQQIQQAANFKQCVFNTTQSPSRQKVIINEVAWMGGLGDFGLTANDEWFELKNIFNSEVDINGWQILDKSENIKIVFDNGTKILTNGFYLLERTDDNSVPNVAADKIYSGTLNNSDEGLRIFDEQCNLIDEVFAAPNWPAGDNDQKRTMERSPDLSWHVYNGIAQNGILGTPKRENSAPTSASTGGGSGGSSANNANNQQQTDNNQQQSAKILINEIQIYPTENRFIELYNPNNFSVNLIDWYLQRKTQTGGSFGSLVSKTYFEGKTINANGYFLISRGALDGADIILDNLTLTESNAVQLKNSDGEIIDKVGWGQASASDCESSCASQLSENQSVQRKFQNNVFIDTDNNVDDFEIQTCPSPRTQSRACQSSQINQALGAFFDNIVISEIQIAGDKADDEFIEIYNPTDSVISLADYSIQYLSGAATSTENIKKKNFTSDAQIAAKSFYLLVNSDAASSLKDKADMTYSAFSLSGNSSGAAIFLVSTTTVISDINDLAIIDSLSYGDSQLTVGAATSTVPDAGQSLERKAFSGGVCVSSQNENEFFGNGCDTDGAVDFEIRGASNPQNSQSFPEPRSAPATPQNFNIQYSSGAARLIFNWQESQDFSGATSTLTYEIKENNGAPTSTSLIVSASTTAQIIIDEVGRDYNFSVQAFDAEGLGSKIATAAIFVPGFLSNLYFYKDPRASSSDYLIEIFYDNYPFIPDVYQNGQNTSWKAMIFYLNGETAKEFYLDPSFSQWYPWPSETIDKILKIKYSACASGVGFQYVLILPDIKENCSVWGGLRNGSLNYHFEDKNLSIAAVSSTAETAFSSNDYLTVAYYSFYRSGWHNGTPEVFQLAAIDKTKYYFGEAPIHRPPTAPLNLTATLDDDYSNLIIGWDDSTDPDTINSLIKYELNYHLINEELDENNWEEVGKNFYQTNEKDENGNDILIRIQTEPNIPIDINSGDIYDIYIRAKDEFGNYSEIVSIEWYPPVFLE